MVLRHLVLLLCCYAGLARCASEAKRIKRVSIVFACHLDIGFHSEGPEPGYDNFVISRYFNEHFPKAVRVAQELRERKGGQERLVFLTHSWLVSMFLDCPSRIGIRCPNATTVADFKEAVTRGDITWHALPHNAQVELYSPDLLQYGVQMTHELDRTFNLLPKITASQRDVPGLTRAAIPLLAWEGVKAISVGVNGGSAPPGVPHNTPFIWRDMPSGKQLLAMWHPGGYSGFPVDSRNECVQVKGLRHALCLSWSGDNTGPPDVEQALDIFKRVQADFPGAKVAAAGFDGFVAELAAKADQLDLPVVTGEIGDTWIHGAASDPAKLSEYRALLRMRTASRERYDDDAFKRFSRMLLKMPEHTWGVDTKQHPGEWESWSNADLQKQLANKSDNNPFTVAVGSWVRQRAYALWAVQELGSSPEGFKAWEALAELQGGKQPPSPAAANSSFKRCRLEDPLLFESHSWQLELSKMTGAVVGLRLKGGSSGGGGGDSSGGGAAWGGRGRGVSGCGSAPTSSGDSSRGGGSSGGGTDSSSGKSGTGGTWPWSWLLSALRLPASWWHAASGGTIQAAQAAASATGRRAGSSGTAGSSSSGGGGGVGGSWAGFNAPLALPVYSTYSEEDYDAIWDEYAYQGRNNLADWFYKDFGKPNATVKGGARRAEYLPQAQEVWWKHTEQGGLHIVVKAAFDPYAVQNAGAPQALWTEIRAPPDSDELQLDVTWQNKTPTRLPEAFWLRWSPQQEAVNSSSWLLYKLGQPISPLEVVLNGSHALHAVGDEGVSVDSADGTRRLYIRSLDAAVVSPGRATPFPSLKGPPDLQHGMAHCLTNNIWGTNYPMWWPYQQGDANMRFRFILQLEDRQQAAQQQRAAALAEQ